MSLGGFQKLIASPHRDDSHLNIPSFQVAVTMSQKRSFPADPPFILTFTQTEPLALCITCSKTATDAFSTPRRINIATSSTTAELWEIHRLASLQNTEPVVIITDSRGTLHPRDQPNYSKPFVRDIIKLGIQRRTPDGAEETVSHRLFGYEGLIYRLATTCVPPSGPLIVHAAPYTTQCSACLASGRKNF